MSKYMFSTMMSNLFAMRADLSSPDRKQWQNEYLQVDKFISQFFENIKTNNTGKGTRKNYFIYNLFISSKG